MKFLILADLHGAKPEIYSKEFDAIICPGDFCDNSKFRGLSFKAMLERDKGRKIEWFDLLKSKKEAREMIEKYQPLICESGHIHEHFGKDKIGKTVCINSGFGSKKMLF